MLLISLCVAVSLLSGLSGQNVTYGRTFNGTCSSFGVSEVKPLNLKLLYGAWYLYATADHGLPLNAYDCIKFVHKRDDDHHINTKESAKQIDSGKRHSGKSRLEFKNPNEGRYTYKAGKISQDTLIIATDHLTYYIEFHCTDEGEKAICYVGVFTKLPEPNDDTIKAVIKFLTKHKLYPKRLRHVVQISSVCDY